MRSELKWRRMYDKVFTLVSAGGVVMLAAGLFTVLGPMLFRGCGAVVFQGTVEWRRFVNEEFARGDNSPCDRNIHPPTKYARDMDDNRPLCVDEPDADTR